MTFSLLVVTLALPAFAGASEDLDAAVRQFEFAELDAARSALVPLVDDPTLTEAERIRARTYLAASEHALGDAEAARAHLRLLFQAAPHTELDPGLFLPDLLRLADEVKADLARERALLEPDVSQQVVEPPHLALALLPFGTGQFVNGQKTKGWLFLTGEALLFGASSILYGMFVASAENYEGVFRGGTFENPARARRLQVGYFATFWAGMALNVGGVVDALVQRQRLGPAMTAARTPPPFPTVHERRP